MPYLLGFHPIESVVALFFDRGRVRLTARVDLPEPAGGARPGRTRSRLWAGGRGAASVVLLVYSSQRREPRRLGALRGREPACEPLEALLVTPGALVVGCSAPGACCPPDGTPYDLSGHPLCAEAVLAGPERRRRPNRVGGHGGRPAAGGAAELWTTWRPRRCSELVGVDRGWRKRRMHDAGDRSFADPTGLSDADCAELAALCLDLDVRDVAWALMSRDEAAEHLTLWRRVLSRTVDDLGLGTSRSGGAWPAWISGNGALLNCCIDRLERARPGLRSARRSAGTSAGEPFHPSLLGRAVGRDARRSGAPGRLLVAARLRRHDI